ncbi:cysteinyl leukotriene receptor 2-like [Megalops cyprinoides]|uniref:cysteinyl leukotriene receptor 2-like n=1 Tax=Megalops cyprinoides TaxID=118141 RepID=UPI0018646E86|nr:cysteinyl leukotriene receptor 2-like [Megalops cyprinoides]
MTVPPAPWFSLPLSHLPSASYPPGTMALAHNQTCGNDDSFKYLAYTITYCIVLPMGLLCNCLALLVFFCFTPKKSANTVLTTNLALSDVGFSLTLPFRLVYYLRGGQWDFPDWLCRWCVFSFYLNLYTSVLFLTGLSVLRYVAVLHPMRNKTLVTVRRASWACLGIWLFVAASSSPFLLSGSFQQGSRTLCFEPKGLPSWRRILVLNYVGVVFGFLLPFLTILLCYGRIIRRLRSGERSLQRVRRRRQRSINLVAVVLVTFLLCFAPYHVMRTAHLHAVTAQDASRAQDCWRTQMLQKVLVLTLCMASSNSCFNPLLYYFAGESFRKTVRRASERRSRSSLGSFSQGSLLPWRGKAAPSPPASPVKADTQVPLRKSPQVAIPGID